MTTLTANQTRGMGVFRSRVLVLGLLLCSGLLALSICASVAFGAADIAPRDLWAALFAFDPGATEHLIIRTLRLPRAATAALVGGALAVAGALMQGLTRNPLADPGLFGIESGAALGVVAAVFFLKINSLSLYALFGFAGAALAAVAVAGLGALGQAAATPLRLTLAGAAITALLSSTTTALLLLNQTALEEVRFWLAGSLVGRDLGLLTQVAPYLLAGLGLALTLGRPITAMALGDDVARGLGQRVGWVRALSALAVVLLAGGAVAVAGPIGFVGLVVPHVVRMFVGADYRWIVPYAALVGAIFLVLADLVARLLLRPIELPVGVMTALIGGPFFIYLVRWRIKR